jgi:hypothetical protein
MNLLKLSIVTLGLRFASSNEINTEDDIKAYLNNILNHDLFLEKSNFQDFSPVIPVNISSNVTDKFGGILPPFWNSVKAINRFI